MWAMAFTFCYYGFSLLCQRLHRSCQIAVDVRIASFSAAMDFGSILLPTGGSCGWFLGSTSQPIGSICGFTLDAAANRFVCDLNLNCYAICCIFSCHGQIWALLLAFAFSSLG
ncbi:hypothetical protein U1Q18_033522 [Sarracenia purpurea var. burkii]